MEIYALRDAVSRRANYSRNVCAVTVAVVGAISIRDFGHCTGGPTTELVVSNPDSGVDDIDIYTGPSFAVGVGIVQRQKPSIDPVYTRGRVARRSRRLDRLDRDFLVSLDIGNIRHGAECLQGLGWQLGAESDQRRSVRVFYAAVELFGSGLCAATVSGEVPGLKTTMYWPGILFFAFSFRTGASFCSGAG